jgi:hypothetical protein
MSNDGSMHVSIKDRNKQNIVAIFAALIERPLPDDGSVLMVSCKRNQSGHYSLSADIGGPEDQ